MSSQSKSLQKANVIKLTENISTLSISDLVVRLGCSSSFYRRRTLPLYLAF